MMSLHPHGMPCRGPRYRPAAISAVRVRRLRQAEVVGEGDDEVERRLVAVQARRVHHGQLGGGHLPRAQELRQVREGPECRLLEIRGPRHRRRPAGPGRPRRAIEPGARDQRAEVERRRDAVGDGDLAQLVVPVRIQVLENLLLVVLAELEPGHRQRIVEHLQRHPGRPVLLHARPQHARQQRRGHARGGEGGEKTAAIERHRTVPSLRAARPLAMRRVTPWLTRCRS